MRYFLRINGDKNLSLPVDHKVHHGGGPGESVVRIIDDARAQAGHFQEPIKVFCMELHEEDEEGVTRIVAFRELPPEAQFLLVPAASFHFQWTLNVIQEGSPLDLEKNL
jgi:hypothetical protein